MSMEDRANRWLQRLDDQEYHVIPELADKEVPNAEEGGKGETPHIIGKSHDELPSYA